MASVIPVTFPSCPALSASMNRRVQQLAQEWARDSTRPRISSDVAIHWDDLLRDWASQTSIPMLVRKFSGTEGRGSVITHTCGRELVPTDNSPAHWAFALAYNGEKPSLKDIRRWFKQDAVPVAWILKREERAVATYTGRNARIGELTEFGWKVCHKKRIGLAHRGSIAGMPEDRLKEHFIDFLAPSNIFVMPKMVGGLGELKQVIDAIRQHD